MSSCITCSKTKKRVEPFRFLSRSWGDYGRVEVEKWRFCRETTKYKELVVG